MESNQEQQEPIKQEVPSAKEEKKDVPNKEGKPLKELKKKLPKITVDDDNPKMNYFWLWAIIIGFLIFSFYSYNFQSVTIRATTNDLKQMLLENDVERIGVVNQDIAEIYLKEASLAKAKYKEIAKSKFGTINHGPHFYISIASRDAFDHFITDFNKENNLPGVNIEYERGEGWSNILLNWLPVLLMIGFFWFFILRRMGGTMGGAGGNIFNIGKSKAILFDKDEKINITFDDVAGLDEAKMEVQEIVGFLKNPEKYTTLGGKIPKGALLIGPPGTGKTLIAKAMAGEAKVPFFSISGSDFVEMFVGVGASRVRDLFRQAREKAPCIIFIDEIDAVGRSRGRNVIQSNDERENTLNQLLVEMDGFAGEKGVIMLAATNRPDVLDPALLRPGRFDRQISIDKPDLVGREQIFKVHLKGIKIGADIDAAKLSAQTPGFVGADIANICNEAALIAARIDRPEVTMQDFQDAIDRAIGGLEKKHKLISPEEKKVIAYHESGHALCGWFLEHAHPLVKVSIVPRGVAALGYAQYLPKEKYLETSSEILDRMCMSLGGRAAERIVFDEISTGAQSDLDHVTKMAYATVAIFGMNEKVGNVSFYDMQNDNSFSKPYSEDTAKMIDEEARKIIELQYVRAQELLRGKRVQLDLLAEELLKKEVLFKDDLQRLLGKRPYDKVEPTLTSEVPINSEVSTNVNTDEALVENKP